MNLLHEVIKRVQAGEDVDIRKELGTGDPVKEKEWEDSEFSPRSSLESTIMKG
jgi:hypothetical protein